MNEERSTNELANPGNLPGEERARRSADTDDRATRKSPAIGRTVLPIAEDEYKRHEWEIFTVVHDPCMTAAIEEVQ